MTNIRACGCDHKEQDRLYGKGMRVHNWARNSPDKPKGGWRCTVCAHDRIGLTGMKVRATAKPF